MLDHDQEYGGLGGFTYDGMLQLYLDAKPKNRMAFEYLMAYYLLTCKFGRVCENLGRLGDFGYAGIPRLYEEAVLLEGRMHPDRPVDLHGRSISPEAVARFEEFLADVDACRSGPAPDRPGAREALTRKWGDSYLFFAVFGFSEPRSGWRIAPPPAPKGGPK